MENLCDMDFIFCVAQLSGGLDWMGWDRTRLACVCEIEFQFSLLSYADLYGIWMGLRCNRIFVVVTWD
jgi:hypothetical protein